MLAAVLVHVGLVLIWRYDQVLPTVAEAAAGPRKGDDQAAEGGGGGMQVLAMRIPEPPPEPEPIPVPAVPIPTPDAVLEMAELEPPKLNTPPQALGTAVSTAPGANEGSGGGSGGGTAPGPGIPGGTGQGDGGTGESGLYRLTPPTPRGLILPPSDRPGRVRGREVVVYVFVTDRGRVVSDSTRLAPSSGDSRFDERLRRQAAEWVFNPARRAGQPIAEWFKYTIVL
jgi:outer membrane biosynthesis protein TonB